MGETRADNPQDRFLPYLFDRLTGTAASRARGRANDEGDGDPDAYLRRAIVRDLTWLLNAKAQPSNSAVHAFPIVAESVLNYGMPYIPGAVDQALTAAGVEELVTGVIERFEPRLVPGSLSVRVVDRDRVGALPGLVELEIVCKVHPLPNPLTIRTEFQLGTGTCRIRDGAVGGGNGGGR